MICDYDKNQKLEFLKENGFEDWQLSGAPEAVIDGWVEMFSEPGNTIEEFYGDPLPTNPLAQANREYYASRGI